jgi:predicted N-acyltransferase
MSDNAAFMIAKLYYKQGDEFPWFVYRLGETQRKKDQQFGSEMVGFRNFEAALEYIEESTKRDMDSIEEVLRLSNLMEDKLTEEELQQIFVKRTGK